MPKEKVQNFSLKFIDIMAGVILGFGFSYWGLLSQNWQYVAFIFAYINIVDYWVDYSPSLKKFPPKKELDVMIDVAIMFSLFLYIFSVQYSISYFFAAFAVFRFLDFLWLINVRHHYHPKGYDGIFVGTWIKVNLIDVMICFALLWVASLTIIGSVYLILIYVILITTTRISASLLYKRLFY